MALFLLAVACVAMSALHVFQPHRSVVHQPLSFYVHGTCGWLLPVALAAFGSGAVALGVVVRRRRIYANMHRWLLAFGTGMLVDAIIPSDRWFPWEGDYSVGGAIHAFAAVVAPPLLVGAMLGRRQGSKATGTGKQRSFDALALAYLLALVASGLSLSVGFAKDISPPLIGLAERALALAAVGWLALFAVTLWSRGRTDLGTTDHSSKRTQSI